MKTLLIDGSNLSIIHFTANPAIDQNGIPVGMVKGFLSTLSWMNRELKPDRIIVFFDGRNNSSERRKIFSEYKEGRKAKQVVGRFFQFSSVDKAEKNKEYQYNILRELLDELPISNIACNNFETDDAISYCVKNSNYFSLDEILIVSCDKDFYQLISDKVLIYNPMSKLIIDKKHVIKEYGISPENWLLYRSITGDSSDNLDGIPGIGPKTILKLFDLSKDIKFDITDVENVCSEVLSSNEEKNKSIRKNLEKIKENLSLIERNWKLMDLTNPMVSSLSSEILDETIMEKNLKFKKLEFWKKASFYSIGLNLSTFDDFKFLMRTNK